MMTVDQERLSLVEDAPSRMGTAPIGLHPLQQASLRLSEFREGRSRLKAKDLVGLLLCHGARAWRASQPAGVVRIKVRGAGSASAVRIRF